MLRELEVRDLGIIDRVRLTLGDGFVVLTGETGAGKSLLVQSLQLLAGERADSEQVRSGAERLLVEGCFASPDGQDVETLLAELGVGAEEELVVRREVTAAGRSRAWLNDVPVTVSSLQRLAPSLLSIHGQHESRGLTDPSTHLELLDRAGGLWEDRIAVGQEYAGWQEARDRLDAHRQALATRRDRLDAISFQMREIDEARLELGEDDELREERAMLRHSERIAELLAVATGALGGEGGGVALTRAARAVSELAEIGLNLGEAAEQLDQARLLAEDAERQLSELGDRIAADPLRLDAVEARLVVLERLSRKYGGSIAAVLEHRQQLRDEQAELDSAEDRLAELEGEEQRRAEGYLRRATELSGLRGAAAKSFTGDVVKVLTRLGMAKVKMELVFGPRAGPGLAVDVNGQEAFAGVDGIDGAELVIAPNPGESPRPMAKIASGGELSRIHLAIRTVLRERGGRGGGLTLLFDEVDSGIGGHVAEELGVMLAKLGRRDQVMVVTHLPQVAGRADGHLVVRKEPKAGRTVTRVEPVEGEERVEEMVRMLGGGPATPAARQHARELLSSS